MTNKHFIFNGKDIIIHPELVLIFKFFKRIDDEILYQLSVNEYLQKITNGISSLLTDLERSGKLLQEKNVAFNYSTSVGYINDLISLPTINNFICSQMICLFAYMETLSCIITVYNAEKEFDSEKELIEKCNDDLEGFIKKYILNDDNDYYKKNINRFSGMGAKNLLKTRNALTHFYSVGNRVGIIPNGLISHYQKVKNLSHGYNYISPNDFYELLKGALKIVLQKWNNDYILDKKNFNTKITFVTNLVKENAAIEKEFTKEMLDNI